MDTRLINIVSLAYLGDSVYEVYVREFLIRKGISYVEDLQREAVKYVSAKSQDKILKRLIDGKMLTENELEVVRRGRNYKRSSHPRNTDIVTYKNSTGFEAMIGYLYLEGMIDRLEELMVYILEDCNEENC